MGIIAWIIVGLVAGAIARLILPGKQAGGWIVTLLLGIVGAFIGGLIARAVGSSSNNGLTDWKTWVFSIVGALIVLAIWGIIRGRGATNRAA